VLDWAAVRKYRSTENPARWKGHLDKILPAPRKLQQTKHHRALPVAQIGPFMGLLRGLGGVGALALEFTILTAARSGEVRGAKWSEISGNTWSIPADRMKAGTAHTVPLSDQARQILKKTPRVKGSDFVFPNAKGAALSDMTLTKVLRDMKVDAVTHGFRSTFRDWAGDMTTVQREVIEHALAHKLPDRVEASYRRSDALEKRRALMQEWADFCDSQSNPA
jgi:integrase